MINLKKYLLHRIEDFIDKGYIFSHTDEMNISTVDATMYMSYDNYIKYPIQAIELKLNMILAKKPNLINSFKRSQFHSSITKHRHIERRFQGREN